jgi:hypothetical protein
MSLSPVLFHPRPSISLSPFCQFTSTAFSSSLSTALSSSLSPRCHLERNKVIGEADDLVESKDPSSVISATVVSGSSPHDADASAAFRQHRNNASAKLPPAPTTRNLVKHFLSLLIDVDRISLKRRSINRHRNLLHPRRSRSKAIHRPSSGTKFTKNICPLT